MTYTWSTGAAAVIEHTDGDWGGIWSLLFAAAKAAFRLSLQLPPGPGAEVAYTAMDLCDARDEIGWAHPDLPTTQVAVDLGPVGPIAQTPDACQVLVDLLDVVLERITLLDASGLDTAGVALARTVMQRVGAARGALAEQGR